MGSPDLIGGPDPGISPLTRKRVSAWRSLVIEAVAQRHMSLAAAKRVWGFGGQLFPTLFDSLWYSLERNLVLNVPVSRLLFKCLDAGFEFRHFKQFAENIGHIDQGPGLGRGNSSLVNRCRN